ncbi:hypothetical protein CYY_000692 [Polysphondylium violaceum]|uniref:Arginyl-tRNA--protein transferase 1 n=1 Tax=Polysphondylium violaceum TaxID=133409 RepID=A0A8J4V5A7_9MYCE|nr:hypothetical protein CYY_000692 [Polysphondylium violaceum]
MLIGGRKQSVVEPYGYYGGECHYCYESDDGRISYGMNAIQLTVEDYQSMIDRGWRRSGTHLYKPDNSNPKACCPQYTIRLDANRFIPTKDNKATCKKLENYLNNNNNNNANTKNNSDNNNSISKNIKKSVESLPSSIKELNESILETTISFLNDRKIETQEEFLKKTLQIKANINKLVSTRGNYSICFSILNKFKVDDNLKQELIENIINTTTIDNDEYKLFGEKDHINIYLSQQQNNQADQVDQQEVEGVKQAVVNTKVNNKPDTTTTTTTTTSTTTKKELKITIEKAECTDEIFSLYCKYQKEIHHEDEKKEKKGFIRFLVDSPLIKIPYNQAGYTFKDKDNQNKTIPIPQCGYGSFHQHYRLDGKLIALGVIDILPHCLSSVYFIYDPDYSFLSLGKYSALQEIKWVQNISKSIPNLNYYYMGYYIKDCPKMNYKGNYQPSDLLCPETYQWVSMEKALLCIKDKKYSAFVIGGDKKENKKQDVDNKAIEKVKLLYNYQSINFGDILPKYQKYFKDKIIDYVRNLGPHLSSEILMTVK